MRGKGFLTMLLILLLAMPLMLYEPACGARIVEVHTITELENAIKNVQKGDTLVLNADIEGDFTNPVKESTGARDLWGFGIFSEDCTLDFNGHTLTINHFNDKKETEAVFLILPNVDVKMMNGSLKVTMTKTASAQDYPIYNDGTLTLEDMAMDAHKMRYALRAETGSTMYMKNCNMYAPDSEYVLILNGQASLENTKVTADKQYHTAIFANPRVTIYSGIFTGKKALEVSSAENIALQDLFAENTIVTVGGTTWSPGTENFVDSPLVVVKAPEKPGFGLILNPPGQMTADVPDVTKVEPGSTVEVTIANPEGETLDKLLANGKDVTDRVLEGAYTFTMPNKTMELVATFKEAKVEEVGYSIRMDPEANLSVNLDRTEGIPEGTEVLLTVTAPEERELGTLLVDGKDVTQDVLDGLYTFTMPAKDIAIAAAFKDDAVEEPPVGYLISIFTIDHLDVRIMEEGKPARIERMDISPYIRNDRTMLPVRFVGQSLNMEVKFDETTRDVLVQDATRSVKLNLDSNVVTTQAAGKPYILDSKPEVIQGRTMLPIGEIADILGFSRTDQSNPGGYLTWDDEWRTVTIMVQKTS